MNYKNDLTYRARIGSQTICERFFKRENRNGLNTQEFRCQSYIYSENTEANEIVWIQSVNQKCDEQLKIVSKVIPKIVPYRKGIGNEANEAIRN